MERLVSDDEVQWLTADPPADTRAWTRALLLRWARKLPIVVEGVDWDQIRFRVATGHWPVLRTIDLANPLSFTKAEVEPIVRISTTLKDVIEGLNALGSVVQISEGETSHASS